MNTLKAEAAKIINFNAKREPKTQKPFKVYQIGEYFLINQNTLEEQLTGFWAPDAWDMLTNPTGVFPRHKDCFRNIFFACKNRAINTEIKYVAFKKFAAHEWSPRTGNFPAQIHRLVRFFNETAPKINSLLDYSLVKWEMLLATFLHKTKQWQRLRAAKITGNQERKVRERGDRAIEVLRVIYHTLADVYDTRPECEKDVWHVRRLGVSVNEARSESTLNFNGLEPRWLREALKKHLYIYVFRDSLSFCSTKISAIKKFGVFLTKVHPTITPDQLNRSLLLEYIGWLTSANKLTPNIRYSYAVTLRSFLESAARENHLPIPEKRMLFEDDFPRRVKRKPRYIPEFVMEQLERLLPEIPDTQIRRMCTVLIEGGMRISELCTIKLNCLSQDSDADYFLLYYQGKLKKEHTIPISRQTADAIIEQRNYVLATGIKTEYLFPRRKGFSYKAGTFNKKLNEFAYAHKIADETGKYWRFQAHQLRHTAATRMINGGVPQHIVQKFMGHESPEMTATYAFIHDETLKKEFQAYRQQRGSLIDIAGHVIERQQPSSADNADLQWFKKNIQAQALPNGYCGLPSVQTACPHANACLTCANFRTDASFLPQHEAQLKQTKQLVQISRTNGWTRQAEMNERIETNLKTIINSLCGTQQEESGLATKQEVEETKEQ